MGERRYSDDEVAEILRVAIEREKNDPSGLERDEIVGAAAEIGIDAELVDRAITQLEQQRRLDAEVTTIRTERRRSLISHASTWALVNAMLFAIDWMDGGEFWFYWPLCGWGIAVLLQARRTLFTPLEKDRARAERRLKKREQKRAEAARIAKRKRAEKTIEDAIEQGVSALLSAAANRIEAGLEGRSRARRRVDPAPDPRATPEDDEAPESDEPAPRRGARRRY